MEFDDIVYLALLISSIGFGYFYRTIKETDQKKNVGTLVGLLIIFIVSGWHIIHLLITTAINAAIVLFVSKKQCHIVSFTFCFLYLFFFRLTEHFGIPYPPAHTNMMQMILVLKMVGLAFEVNTSYLNKNARKDRPPEGKGDVDDYELNINFIDVFHYAFNYIGIIAGPYFRYKTFEDYFKYPFHQYVSWKEVTINKLKYIPLYAVLFLLATHFWPLSYALTKEFYNERSFFYRFWYVWPNFFIFRMRMYIGLVLSECICTMAGLGFYPIFTEPKPGHGPTAQFEKLNRLPESQKEMEKIQYDCETIHNVDPYGADFCITFRESMKNWNICVQYWLAVCIYKRFPNKKFRTAATMLVSAVWHGMYTGYYVCIGGVPFYLPIEDIYVKLYMKDNSGLSLKIWTWIIWFFKMFALSYLAIAFHLMTLPTIWYYYNSVYHAGFIIFILMYVVGLQLLKARKSKELKTK